jgi:thiol:disulfide interchange protein
VRRPRDAVIALLVGLLPLFPAAAQRAEVTARVEPESLVAGATAEVHLAFTFGRGLHQIRQEEFFFARLESVRREGSDEPAAGFRPGPSRYPAGAIRDGAEWYDSPVTLVVPLTLAADLPAGGYLLTFDVGYQLCDDKGLCYLPREEDLTLRIQLGPAASASSAGPVAPSVPAGGLGLVELLLMAFLGGLILNFMPCVLPVLSIKALSLVKQSGDDRGQILRSAFAYAAGIVVSFLALAGIVVALKASGELVGWGFQFQSPGYVVALLAVMFVFALSLFEVFPIGALGTGLAIRASGVGGLASSFLTGAMAVLLATPCTAPFLGTALGYAFSQPPALIVLMFAVVGLGLALPFLLLGFWPALVWRIPKPGPWTGVFRTVMGFLLIGTAIYLLDVLLAQVGGEGVIRALAFLAVLAVAAWVYGRFGGPTAVAGRRWAVLGLAVAIGVAGGLVALRWGQGTAGPRIVEGPRGPASSVPDGWSPFSPELVDRSVAAGEPVFLAFGARWCWTCRTNEATVLAAREVREAFAARGVRLVHGDYTNQDELVGAWLARFGRAGVPLYVYFPPYAAEPVVLPEVLTRRMVLELLGR